MLRGLLRRLLRPSPAVPPPSPLDYRAALARLEADVGRVDAALRRAFDERRAALLAGDDAEVDRLDAVIDALSREQERAEVIERELVARASKLPETFS